MDLYHLIALLAFMSIINAGEHPASPKGHTHDVVMRMCTGLEGQEHVFFPNNFSLALADSLMETGVELAGTINPNQVGPPVSKFVSVGTQTDPIAKGDDCVLCGFSGSPHTPTAPAPPFLPSSGEVFDSQESDFSESHFSDDSSDRRDSTEPDDSVATSPKDHRFIVDGCCLYLSLLITYSVPVGVETHTDVGVQTERLPKNQDYEDVCLLCARQFQSACVCGNTN